MIDVDALIAFCAVIDAGSFSGAAERLHQTPSGVSRTISRLEKHLGMTLMQRTTRSLHLTEEGACCWRAPARHWPTWRTPKNRPGPATRSHRAWSA